MTAKEDPQAGQFDHEWGSRKAVEYIEKMRRFDEQRKAHATASKEFRELFVGHVEDAGLKPGTRVRMGKYVTMVVERTRAAAEVEASVSVGRSQIKLLE